MGLQALLPKLGRMLTLGMFPFAIATLPTGAEAASFSKLYIFGDSLVDTGNVFQASGGTFPPFPYFQGRFSNGPVWSEYLAQGLGIPTSGITNLAFGGATTGTANTIILPGLPPFPGLQQQVASFLASNTKASEGSLFVISAGANDYLPTQSPTFTPFTSPATPISNLQLAIQSLYSIGARKIVVSNLPDLGNTPLVLGLNQSFPGISPGLNLLSQAHNASLNGLLSNLSQALPGTQFTTIDINGLLASALANPGSFGFTNTTTPCISVLACVFNPAVQNQFLFWDQIHPTTATHAQIGQLAVQAVQSQSVPEGSVVLALLIMGGLGVAGQVQRQRSAQKVLLRQENPVLE